MSKNCTKAAGNVFTNARYKASTCNERMKSRDGAAEETGIDRTRIARIELGTITPYPEEVLLMSDIYGAPELMNHYCTSLCPIGKKMLPKAECIHIERLVIKFLHTIEKLPDAKKRLIRLASEGVNDADIDTVTDVIDQMVQVAFDFKIWREKNLKKA